VLRDIPDSCCGVAYAVGPMPLLSTRDSANGFLPTAMKRPWGQIMPIVCRHNVLDAKIVQQWPQFLRNRWIIPFRIGYAKNRTRALWWSISEAAGRGPSLSFIRRT